MDGYRRFFYAASSIFVFVFGLQLLGESTQAVASSIEGLIRALVTGDLSALGAGWFIAYLVLNGATSAAIGIAFLESGLVTASNAFMMIAGSRLGASFIVVFIGALEYVQGKNPDLRDSCSVGILQFLTTYAAYIPAILLGYLILRVFDTSILAVSAPASFQYGLDLIFGGVTSLISSHLGPVTMFLSSVGVLVWSLQMFDRGFKGISEEKFRSKYLRFQFTNRWVAFGMGAAITLVTTSVALSVGIIVPLYNRGYFRRKEIIPYLMGANITTMISSIMAAAVMESKGGMMSALLLTLTVFLTTLGILLVYDRFYSLLKRAFDGIMLKDRYLLGFTAVLVLIPLIFILL
jgi:sodium-dependent phosphate cotransporter